MEISQKQRLDRIYSGSGCLGPSPRGHSWLQPHQAHLAALPGGVAERMSVSPGNRPEFLEKCFTGDAPPGSACPSGSATSSLCCPMVNDGLFPHKHISEAKLSNVESAALADVSPHICSDKPGQGKCWCQNNPVHLLQFHFHTQQLI